MLRIHWARVTCVGTLAVCLAACQKQAPTPAATRPTVPAVPVTVAQAQQETIPFELKVVGSALASSTVQVKSQVAGQLVEVHLTEGQDVKKDALLFEIDPRPYVEILKQAEATLARDRAQLRQAEANLSRSIAELKNAEANEERYADLAKQGIISKQQYEQMRTTADVARESSKAAQAAIESARAAVQSDQAAIDKAKLDISYCQIKAPLSGRAGNLLVHPGNLVQANGNAPLVVINQIAPIFVTFSVPETHLSAIRARNGRSPLIVSVALADDPSKTVNGRLSVIDNTVDTATGTIALKAVVENRDRTFWPGQFVNVKLQLDAIPNATVVPAEAVQEGQTGQFVFVVKADSTVEPRKVTVGRTFENRTVIQSGVAPGEKVVTDGHLRLAPGSKIQEVAPVPKVGVERS
ncbi:MAG: efflux RND transporter periplasmic adaptor subunit [Bryobacterales bacterium]|nr:efflux RND transporter periplasmic adaptor subunit [Bryobacterales bacterium]